MMALALRKKAVRWLINTPLIYTPLRLLISFATWDQWAQRSWAQEGEDLILDRVLSGQKKGFYVDVGAHHPKRFSNTFMFYKRGWRGINIDAMPGSMRAFNKSRPRDINLEFGIGEREGKLPYYVFNEPALNGFSKDLSKNYQENEFFKIKRVIEVNVFPLRKVLNNYLPVGQTIDFMSVDAEGFDFKVLKSNDWKKYRAKFVLVEILNGSLHDIEQSDIGQYMRHLGYIVYAKCINTVFFKDNFSE